MADLYDLVHADPEVFINHYVMIPELWKKFDISDFDVDILSCGCVKMLNDSGDDINAQIYCCYQTMKATGNPLSLLFVSYNSTYKVDFLTKWQ